MSYVRGCLLRQNAFPDNAKQVMHRKGNGQSAIALTSLDMVRRLFSLRR